MQWLLNDNLSCNCICSISSNCTWNLVWLPCLGKGQQISRIIFWQDRTWTGSLFEDEIRRRTTSPTLPEYDWPIICARTFSLQIRGIFSTHPLLTSNCYFQLSSYLQSLLYHTKLQCSNSATKHNPNEYLIQGRPSSKDGWHDLFFSIRSIQQVVIKHL